MKKWNLRTLGMYLGNGLLLQTTGCIELGVGITTLATTVTAGGVIYLITRILED